jgi:DNA-directed RNA polymerase specialized sigma subunit
MFDLLADGAWHTNTDIVAATMTVCAEQEREDALRNGERVRAKTLAKGTAIATEDLIASGAKDLCRNRLMIAVRSGRVERHGDQHRMLADVVAQWVAQRGTTAPAPVAAPTKSAPVKAAPTKATPAKAAPATKPAPAQAEAPAAEPTPARRNLKDRAPLIFGGMSEADGFLDAPLVAFTRVHFRTNLPIPLREFRADLPTGTTVTHDEGTGLYRVDHPTLSGIDLAYLVKDWAEDHQIITEGLRPERNQVRRRSLHDLSPRFLDDLCRHYGPYSLKRLQQHFSTLRMHYTENDDIVQRVSEWILEAVAQFDDTRGVPFGAFLAGKLSKWVHDLNRNSYGRVLTDHENKTHSVIAKFVQAHHRPPTDAELAQALGQSVGNLRKNATAVANINALRNVGTIDSGIDDPEIPLPGSERVEDQLMDAMDKSALSQALIQSCAADPTAKGRASQPNVLGFATWYATTWGEMTKTNLATALDTSMRNMNAHSVRAGDRMAAALSAAG